MNYGTENNENMQNLKISEFNSSNNFIRTTSNRFPMHNNLIKQSGIPFGVHITPMNNYEELPLFSFGNEDLPRCKNRLCMGYMNPNITWASHSYWICNLCESENILDEHLNDFKTKLNTGTYEFIANATYMDRAPMPPTFIFIIDVSLSSIESGFFISVIETIKDIFSNIVMQNPDRTNFAFITYDTHVNFFKFDFTNKYKTNDTPQMLSVSDDDMFLPVPEDYLLIPFDENRENLLKFLDYLQSLYSLENPNYNRHKDSNQLLNSIEAGHLVIKKTGGKMLIFNSSVNWIKTNKIKNENKFLDTPKNELIYTILDSNQYLKQLGINLTNSMISCDIFQMSQGKTFTNLLTLNEICTNTNGNLFFYKNFNIDLHYKNIFNTIRRIFTESVGWETLCKIRFSPNLQVKELYTPVLSRNLDLLIMPLIDSKQAFTFTIENKEEKIEQNGNYYNMDSIKPVFIQVALLYTHYDGSRRIRVINYSVQKCNSIEDYYEDLDIESLSTLFTKLIINNLFTCKQMDQAHKIFQNNHYQTISFTIRDLIKRNKNKFDYLRVFPQYILGMIKNKICCLDEIKHLMDVDLSNYFRIKILKMNVDEVISFIYPRVYDLKSISFDEDGLMNISNIIPLNKQNLIMGPIYIIDNGYNLILYVTFKNSDDRKIVINSLLGLEDNVNIESLTEQNVLYKEYSSEQEKNYKEKLIRVIEYFRSLKTFYQNLIIIIENSQSESIVKEILIEEDFCPWFRHTLFEMMRILN